MTVDPVKARTVIEALESGSSLREAAKAAGVSHGTVLNWEKADAQFADQYARAREIGYKLLADELLQIADDSSGDTIVDEDGNEKQNHEFVARSRLRVDTRKWMLAKMLPKVYGEKIDHAVSGGITVTLSRTENDL